MEEKGIRALQEIAKELHELNTNTKKMTDIQKNQKFCITVDGEITEPIRRAVEKAILEACKE